MFGPVSSHLLSIVPGSVWNNFSGPAQFPNQHPTEKPWLWSSPWLSNLCRAKTSNTVNHSVLPEVTPGDGGQASDFLQPLPWGRNCFPCFSVPRQTSPAAPHQAKAKPSCSNLPKLRCVPCHHTALQGDSSHSATSTHKWVNFPALCTNRRKN